MRRGWGGVRNGKFNNRRVYHCSACGVQREAVSAKIDPNSKVCPYCGDDKPISFMSKKEAQYYRELLLREQCGLISDIQLQPPFVLQAGIKYVADFAYTDAETGKRVFIDVKGKQTTEFKLKMKLLKVAYPDITIVLT